MEGLGVMNKPINERGMLIIVCCQLLGRGLLIVNFFAFISHLVNSATAAALLTFAAMIYWTNRITAKVTDQGKARREKRVNLKEYAALTYHKGRALLIVLAAILTNIGLLSYGMQWMKWHPGEQVIMMAILLIVLVATLYLLMTKTSHIAYYLTLRTKGPDEAEAGLILLISQVPLMVYSILSITIGRKGNLAPQDNLFYYGFSGLAALGVWVLIAVIKKQSETHECFWKKISKNQ